MNYVPLIIFAAVIVVLLVLAGRARRRQAVASAELAERIAVGSDVMTTSGLHGTVVAKHEDDTVTLAIAPGVEVKWELAALRDAQSLPGRALIGPASEAGSATPASATGTGPDLTKDEPGTGETR